MYNAWMHESCPRSFVLLDAWRWEEMQTSRVYVWCGGFCGYLYSSRRVEKMRNGRYERKSFAFLTVVVIAALLKLLVASFSVPLTVVANDVCFQDALAVLLASQIIAFNMAIGSVAHISLILLPRSDPKFASISDKERLDPHSSDLMDSNDVLESEIALAEEGLVEDQTFALNMRLTLMRGKLQILVYNVQND
eukprot:gene27853-34634_t